MLQSDFNGGDSRDRTGDLLLARQALSQLSYIPVFVESSSVSLAAAFPPRLACSAASPLPRTNALAPLCSDLDGSTDSVFKVVGPSGLEPPTLRLSVVRSSQLSYGPISFRPSHDLHRVCPLN